MEFLADLESLEAMMRFIRQEAEASGIDEKLVNKIQLASEEAIVNIISYAYPKEKGKLFIDCNKKGHRFEIIIRDQGAPFNPIDTEVNPQVNDPMDKRRIGGLGIYLLRKVIDEVSYQRVNEENVLQLTFAVTS